MTMKFNADKFFTAASVAYVILPVMLFFAGWLKMYISIPAVLVCIFLAWSIYRELTLDECRLVERASARFWLIILGVMCVLVMLSGIGNFSYQNGDFIARNPLYRDVCIYDWPVIYDLSEQTPFVQSIVGSGKVALSYYFSWWLAPAFVSKIFSCGQIGQNICIYVWAVLGMFLIAYNLCVHFRRKSFAIVMIFIFFSGLDVVGFFIMWMIKGGNLFPDVFIHHIEWWSGLQLSSNTTQLFWVFNQSIPTWLIMILLLNLKSNKNFMALASLVFAYSPWAVFGMIPIAVYAWFESKDNFRQAFTFQNIAVSLLMLVIYGAFYASGTGVSEGSSHFNIHGIYSAGCYLMMIFLEVVIFFIIMGKSAVKYRFYYVVLAELVLFPTYTLVHYNFFIRATIPALFVLMVFVMKFIVDENRPALRIRRMCLIAVLAVGALTATGEISRSVAYDTLFLLRNTEVGDFVIRKISKPALKKTLLQEEVYSVGKMRTDNAGIIKNMFMDMYFTYNLNDTFFFGHLAKGNADM